MDDEKKMMSSVTQGEQNQTYSDNNYDTITSFKLGENSQNQSQN